MTAARTSRPWAPIDSASASAGPSAGDSACVGGDFKAELLTARTARHDANRSAPGDAVGDAFEGKFLAAVELQRVDAVLVREQERDHAHADQVGTVSALERACDHGAHTEQGG